MRWLEQWPNERRPQDVRAFSEAVEDLLEGGGLPLAGGDYLLGSPRGRALIANPDITPAQAIAIMIAEVRGVAALLRRGKREGSPHRKRWLLVTEEMESASALVSAVPGDRRSRFE